MVSRFPISGSGELLSYWEVPNDLPVSARDRRDHHSHYTSLAMWYTGVPAFIVFGLALLEQAAVEKQEEMIIDNPKPVRTAEQHMKTPSSSTIGDSTVVLAGNQDY